MENINEINKEAKKEASQQEAPKYWLSLEQWRKDPEFQKIAENEFMSSPLGEKEEGWARREFLKLMTASVALTSFGCIRRPVQKIVPYANRPEEIIPGLANYYSSSFTLGSEVFGVVVKTREGKPIKVEGNPEYPVNGHGLSAQAHAHLLSLYDPDRLTKPKKLLVNDEKTNYDAVDVSYADLDKEVLAQLAKGKTALLTGNIVSPSTNAIVNEFKRAFNVDHFQVESEDLSSVRDAGKASYNLASVPRYRIEKAKMIVSVGNDFLGAGFSATENMRKFAMGRNPDEGMNRLVVFESMLSLTGANADSRIRIKPSQQLSVVLGLLHQIVVKDGNSSYANDSRVNSVLKSFANVAQEIHMDADLFKEIAQDLWKHRGESLVVAGSDTDDSLAVQIAVNLLNSVLGNEGKTIDRKNSPYQNIDASWSSLKDLADKLEAGEIKNLIISGVNPGYTAGQSDLFKKLIKKAEFAVYIGDRINETGRSCQFVIPSSHDMEEWGDSEAQEGTYLIQQPTISPLYDSRSLQSNLLLWLKAANKGSAKVSSSDSWYDYLRRFWSESIFAPSRARGVASGSFEDFWYELLQKGYFVANKIRENSHGISRFSNSALVKVDAAISKAHTSGDFELQIYRTVGLGDGTLANVSWLQEFPDPVTKICWENYVSVSPKVAEKIHLKEGQFFKISVGEKSITAPVHVQPGLHDEVIAIAQGYGRTHAGQVANGIGVDVNPLVVTSASGPIFSGAAASLSRASGDTQLACPQGHHSMEGRQIIIEATLDQYKRNKAANIHKHKVFSLWAKHEYNGHKWSMAIDLSKCTGCSACVVACQSENNIPVVGKQYVIEGRIMQWIRIDRYYTGDPQDPDSLHMPVMCQHCDNAPCETVCPVAATVHDEEGLNDMIYNRCVGTRYCANNCPYKVRRFNWFDYTGIKKPLNMAMNPEVSQRARGVMEKCSFCKPRIKTAKMMAKNEGRALKDGDVKVACQESCPTQAIVFGDINDKDSMVHKHFNKENSYKLLEELNAVPAVSYATKIRNAHHLKGASHHGNEHGQESGGH